MIQIIATLDLSKTYGRDNEYPSVVDVFNGKLFNVNLDKGEMLAQKYSCNLEQLRRLEELHGTQNVVIISKNMKGKEKGKNDKGESLGFYYNDVVQEVLTLQEYSKKKAAPTQEAYTSKFAVQRGGGSESNVTQMRPKLVRV